MTKRDFSRQLHEYMDDILDDGDVIASYWKLAKPLFEDLNVHRFYVRAEDDYTNVGILAGGVVIDVEALEDDDHGHISVYRIDAISGVSFYEDPVPTVPDSDEAELVVTVSSTHGNEDLVYWMAYTEEDAQHLAEFGKALVSMFPDATG